MSYLVSLQELDMPWGFTHSFGEDDRDAILAAVIEVTFMLEKGSGRLHRDGDLLLTLKSPGGFSHHFVDYAEICRQLRNPKDVVLYDHRKNNVTARSELEPK